MKVKIDVGVKIYNSLVPWPLQKECDVHVNAKQDKDKSPIEAFEEAFQHAKDLVRIALGYEKRG